VFSVGIQMLTGNPVNTHLEHSVQSCTKGAVLMEGPASFRIPMVGRIDGMPLPRTLAATITSGSMDCEAQ
jgi:hypothetical protein